MPNKHSKNTWAGVDLAASVQGLSAVAWGTHPSQLQVCEVRSDEELLRLLKAVAVVWVDAPLSRGEGPFRACDRLLHKEGISVMPLTWPAMRRLHERALSLRAALPHARWYETFPWALYKRWGLRRKSLPALQQAFAERDITLPLHTLHAYDAVAAWWIGWLWHQNAAVPLMGPDGVLWVPVTQEKNKNSL